MDPQETKIFNAVLIACVIIGFIILYFAFSLIRQQRRYLALSRKNILAEMAILEKDRMRIAADLHDELCPILVAVKFQIDSLDTATPEDQESVVTSMEQIDYLSSRLRTIAKDLMPVALRKKGLINALQEYFTMINQSAPLKVYFSHNISSDIDDEIKINCYRIIQEICNNTLKHAKASILIVQLEEKNKILKLLCEDNGLGFNYEKQLTEETGIGLRSIKNRAEIISNNFMVKSVKDKGTQYVLDIPLN